MESTSYKSTLLVNVHTAVHQSPHKDIGEEVLKNEPRDELLLVEEMYGVSGGPLCEVIKAQNPRGHEVEEEPQEGRQTQDPSDHAGQD